MQYKKIIWFGSTKKNLKTFPKEVQAHIGYALYEAQKGDTHQDAKLMKGFKAMVWEIVSRHFGNTYRAVYYVKVEGYLYVLHVFQKKSTFGIGTPNNEINLIKQRLTTLL